MKYLWLIGDGDNLVHHTVQLEVTNYGCDVQKVECANNAVKCFCNQMELLCNNHPRAIWTVSDTNEEDYSRSSVCHQNA